MRTAEPIELRPGNPNDTDDLVRISTGPIAGKRSFIAGAFGRRVIVVACRGAAVVGYAVWDRSFFGRPFLWLLGVDPAFRGRRIASRLLHAFETDCPHEGRFASTNESNRTMQAILEHRGFVPSGRVENLDPGDPELFYYRAPRTGADRAPNADGAASEPQDDRAPDSAAEAT